VSVLLIEPSRELPLVQLVVTFLAGGVHDPADREGLARVVGRMLRRGSRGMTGEAVEEKIDALGGELGIHVGLGATSVSGEVVTRSAEAMASLMATVLSAPSFVPEELDKLKRQTLAEIVSAREDDGGLASRALRRHLFAGHSHGRRVQGRLASVREISAADVSTFYRKCYCANNAIVAISGDVDEVQAERLASILLGDLPPGARLDYPAAEPVARPGRRLCVVDKPERSQCQLGIGGLGSRPQDPDYLALVAANTVFGGTFTSRLNQEVRVKRGWSYGTGSSLASGHVREAFTIWSAPAAEDAAACLNLELELFDRFCADGISEEELSFCRDYLRRSYAFEIDTAKKRLQQKLERAVLELPDDFHDRFVERIGVVTVAEANEAIRRRLDPRALCVAAVCTDGEIGASLRSATPWTEAVIEPFDLE
jgi:zinc protease